MTRQSEGGVAGSVRLGAVSFLNTKPLIEGLDAERGVALRLDVPSKLPAMLARGEVDAALVPVVEWARAGSAWRIVSDACIGCDGETLTVRVFSRVPPNAVRRIVVDTDSRTSVVLAKLIWSGYYAREVAFAPQSQGSLDDCEAVLLIGDKVVRAGRPGFPYQVDLGSVWKEWTGLPFVFAVWAADRGCDAGRLGRLLSAARDRGVANARDLARRHGPVLGWPVELAEAYLTRHMQYVLTSAARGGMERFLDAARTAGLLDEPADAVAR